MPSVMKEFLTSRLACAPRGGRARFTPSARALLTGCLTLLWATQAGAEELPQAIDAVEAGALTPQVQAQLDALTSKLSATWILTAAALVFMMQAGFLVFEIGVVRIKNTMVTAMKNVGDWAIVSLAFFMVGFGLMFGDSVQGFFGSSLFMGADIEAASASASATEGGHTDLGWAFVVFQLAFAGTAATIVSGAMAERTGFKAYLVFAALIGAVIFPVFGHWTWGSLYLGGDNEGWLAALGYRDFAGASVVHVLGGVASLVGVWIVGPRLGRYASDGRLLPMESHGMTWSALGTLLLWFGWWGFNGGSTLIAGQDVAPVIFNTNIAGAVAGLTGFLHCSAMQGRENLEEKFLGSILGGLVAITASANVVTPLGAVLVGAVAGPLHNVAFDLIVKRLRLDDVVGAIPVHAACGMWGTMAVGILGQQELLPLPRVSQIAVQALGLGVCIVWTGGCSFIAFRLLRATTGVRVDPMREIQGLRLSPAPQSTIDDTPAEVDDEMDRLMADIRGHLGDDDRFDEF